MSQESSDTPFRSGYVAVVGLPNVGKSTLLNQLLRYKLSIVTRKPQTTRKNVLGILNERHFQIVFIDTPGILKPKYSLQKFMMNSVQSAMQDADALLYMIDVSDRRPDPQEIKEQLTSVKKPVILVLNKIDLIDKRRLLPLISMLSNVYSFKALIPISARKNEGLGQLIEELIKWLPAGPPYYPSDYLSDQQERFFVAEIIREKIFQLYSEEIPYAAHVEIEEFKERKKGKDYIRGVIYLERASQKSILIGKDGQALKRVGQQARQEIDTFLGRPVYLELHIKVMEDWRRKDAQLKKLGYS